MLEIDNLKELKALIKVCRRLGLVSFKNAGIELHLGPMPIKRSNGPTVDETAFPEASIQVPQYDGPITEPDTVPNEGLTEDQLLFYSAQSHEQENQ